jgi:hypothetical protein
MSDLSDLDGVFPTSVRWNAEDGILGISAFNSGTGERELQEIELGAPATFAMDLLTRVRGYGAIRVGFYDMRLTPVGTPPPPRPEDDQYKPALGCWLWSPTFEELRLETNGAIFRNAVTSVWDQARFAPQAAEGLQPVIRFVDRVPIFIKAVGETFQGPVIKIVGWVERDKVPGWSERPATVPPKILAALPTTAAAPAIDKAVKEPAKVGSKTKPKTRRGKPGANDPDDSIDDILGNDPIPYA